MSKLLILSELVLFGLLLSASPAIAGPCSPEHEAPGIFVPDRGCFALGIGYEYQHFNVFGTTFHTNNYNANLTVHLFDWLTGAAGRLTVGAEAAVNAGFGGHTTGNPSLDAKSLFVGGGPHLAVPSSSRFEPWAHGLVGLEHFRFTQSSVLGSNSALGFIVGGGVDIRLTPLFYWRLEGDYVGTTFQSSVQSNYGFGTGVVWHF
jgi:hypothetical protein